MLYTPGSRLLPLHVPTAQRQDRKAGEVELLFPTRLEQLLCHFASSDVSLYFVCEHPHTQRGGGQRDVGSPKEANQAAI